MAWCAVAQDQQSKAGLDGRLDDREALNKTLHQGQVIYYSRSRGSCGARVNLLVKHNN